MLLGIPQVGTLSVDSVDLVKNQKVIRGCFLGSRADLVEALDIAGRGLVLHSLLSYGAPRSVLAFLSLR